jgi:glycosyltransferase 2 family protein
LWLSKPQELWKALKLADFRWILMGVLFSVLWLVMRSMVWRSLLRNIPSFNQTFFTVSEGYLLNNLLPFRLGEVARSLLMSQKIGHSFWEVFSSVIIERLLDLIMTGALILTSVALIAGSAWSMEAAIGVGIAGLIGLIMLYVIAKRRAPILQFLQSVSSQRLGLKNFITNQMTAFFAGLAVITDPLVFLRSIGWMGLNWVTAIFQYYFFLKAFFPDATLLLAAFVLGAASVGLSAPSSPGGLGVFELAIVTALSFLGRQPAMALAFALTIHLMGYFITGILGAIGLARDGETLTGLFVKARQALVRTKAG